MNQKPVRRYLDEIKSIFHVAMHETRIHHYILESKLQLAEWIAVGFESRRKRPTN